MFNPPSEKNWVYTHFFDESYAEAYINGYKTAEKGFPESDNPHELSGHERDTTFDDELHYWWCRGYEDFG